MTIYDRIQKLMQEQNIENLHQLSIKSKIPYTSLVGSFKDRRDYDKMKITTAAKLAAALGCTIDYLVYGRDRK